MTDRKQVLWGISDGEDKLFLSKMCDLCDRSETTGRIMYSRFLNPKQQMLVRERLSDLYDIRFFGGYDEADRAVAAFVPNEWEEICYPVAAIKICPTNKRNYSHRDYLGAVLSLGIVRELTGDIVIVDDGAIMAVLTDIADFIMQNLTGVASSGVSLAYIEDMSFLRDIRSFEHVSSTVSSMRLDCVLSAAVNRSRSQASSLIEEGLTSLNYEVTKNTSRTVRDGDVISVRGFGKFEVRSEGYFTKKGRIHVEFKKYV